MLLPYLILFHVLLSNKVPKIQNVNQIVFGLSVRSFGLDLSVIGVSCCYHDLSILTG